MTAGAAAFTDGSGKTFVNILEYTRGRLAGTEKQIVGYQAAHTLGRRLVEKRMRVKIFGVERERRCEVVVLNGFSAHADQKDLLHYATECRSRGPVRTVCLVHGDPAPQKVLAQKLSAAGFADVPIPAPGDKLER